MELFVDLDSLEFVAGAGLGTRVTRADLKRGDTRGLELTFVRDKAAVTLAAGAVVKVGIKKTAVFDGDFLAVATFAEPGAEETAYTSDLALNTAELNALLEVDADTTNDLASVACNLEVSWSEDSGTSWLSSVTLPVRMANDVIKGDEGTPSELPDPDAYVRARAVVYDAVQSLSAAQKAQARANIGATDAAGSGATTYAELTDKSTADLPVINNPLATALGLLQPKPAEGAFADGDKTKLDLIEAEADKTDTANVTAAGALMDFEVTNLPAVKSFDPSDYATSAQGTKADSALQPGDPLASLDTVVTGTQLDGIKTLTDYLTVTAPTDLDAIRVRVDELDAAIVLQGTWDASTGVFPGGGTAQAGALYIVSVAGTVDGVAFETDDRIVALTDNASTTVYAANWFKRDYTDAVLSVAGLTGNVTAADLKTQLSLPANTVTELTGKQPLADNLTAEAGLTGAVDKISYYIGLGVKALTDFTAYGRTLVAMANKAALKTELDLTGTNSGDQDLSALALKSNVLERDNTDVYTPSANYHPATKKYVDDNSGGAGLAVLQVTEGPYSRYNFPPLILTGTLTSDGSTPVPVPVGEIPYIPESDWWFLTDGSTYEWYLQYNAATGAYSADELISGTTWTGTGAWGDFENITLNPLSSETGSPVFTPQLTAGSPGQLAVLDDGVKLRHFFNLTSAAPDDPNWTEIYSHRSHTPKTLTGTTPSWNVMRDPVAFTTLTAATTISLENLIEGQTFRLEGQQDATGGRSLSITHPNHTIVGGDLTTIAGQAANARFRVYVSYAKGVITLTVNLIT